jgi:hypothetical protein
MLQTVVLVSLFVGMLLFQESSFVGPDALLGKVLAFVCFVLLVIGLWVRRKKEGVDPAIMSKDADDLID